ncbi:oxidoreductase [Halobacteriales archaeon SW_7_68_16]|nr:MAG: oxidoreductase [Halobacteriales archaeon SW_7_68_16]
MTTLPEIFALSPAIVLALGGLTVLLVDSVTPEDVGGLTLASLSAGSALIALGIAVWFLVAGTGQPPSGAIELYGDQLVVDGASLFFTVIFVSVTALVAVASYDYLQGQSRQAVFHALILFAATGMTLMASANTLATAFVALELSSLPSYALVAFLKDDEGSVEAGLKYFLIGALSSAILVYGISLVYAVTGSLTLPAVAGGLVGTEFAGVVGLGILMTLGGFAFKTASVPFHFWAPEAYEGAPGPISAFLSSASKAAGFVLAFRVLLVAFPIDTVVRTTGVDWVLAIQLLTVATMTLGNFAAAVQSNVKRMLAYSSVGHAGYALIGLAAVTGPNSDLVLGASMAHLFVYGFMNTGAFLFVALAETWGVGRTFEDYAGLGWRAPFASAAMTVFMFSLAGLPPFGGFVTKYVLFLSAVDAGLWWLAAIGAINSALSLYYYSRVVRALWIEGDDWGRSDAADLPSRPVGLYASVVVAAAITVLLLPGFDAVLDPAMRAADALVS